MSGFFTSGSPRPSPPYSPRPSPPYSPLSSPPDSPPLSSSPGRRRSYSPGAPPLSPLQRRAADVPEQDEALEVRETPINMRNVACVAALACLGLVTAFLAFKTDTENINMGTDFPNPFSPCH